MTVRSVCVYCGSSGRVAEIYRKVAQDVGTALGKRGVRVIYGGGRVGLMGLVADSALAAGGEVVGIIPEHIQAREIQHKELTELHVVDSMHTRKKMMVERSEAFVVLPGGLGTLDETFEILTWKQLLLHNKPVLMYNVEGYWDPFLHLINHIIGTNFAQPSNRNLFSVVQSVDEMFEALGKPCEPAIDPATKWM